MYFSQSRRPLASVLFALLLLVISKSALACTCAIEAEPFEKAVSSAYHQYDLVFYAIASTVSVEQKKRTRGIAITVQTTQFDTLEVFKGTFQSQYLTRVNTTCCLCGFSFTEGETYLVYAAKSDNGNLQVNSCSRTKIVESDDPELLLLRHSKMIHGG